jgi:CO/xanthine dehydrogenase FAD-binding subunit
MRDGEYFTPETLDEAAALLMAAEGQVRPLADGTDLVTVVHEGSRRYSMILDLTRIPELNRMEYDERGGLRVGAAVPFTSLLEFPPVPRLYPMLADGSGSIASREVQARATLGGNLSHASLAGELAPPLICLRASAAIFGPHGWSELAVEAVFAAAGRAVLQPGEFFVDVRFPAPLPRSNGAYIRAARQNEAESEAAGVGAFLVMEEDLVTCCGARLTFCGLSPTPMRALETERFLSGRRLEGAVLEEAGDLAAHDVGITTEGAGSAGGPVDLVRGLTRRAIARALERIQTISES